MSLRSMHRTFVGWHHAGCQAVGETRVIISILSLFVAVTGAAAAYVYFRKSRKYKELSYEILPTLSLALMQIPPC
jgi:hypothetical protein